MRNVIIISATYWRIISVISVNTVFTVRGKKQEIPPYVPEANKMLYWNKTNVIQEPGMELVVPKGMLYDDAELRTRVIGDSNSNFFRLCARYRTYSFT